MATSVIIFLCAALVLGASAFPRRAHPKKNAREYDEAIESELMQPPPALPDQGMAVSDEMNLADGQMDLTDSQMDSRMDPGAVKENSEVELDQSLPEALKKAFEEIRKLVEVALAGSLGDREAVGKLAKVVEANAARIDRIEKEIVRVESVVTAGFKALGLDKKVEPTPQTLNLLDIIKELIGRVGDTKARRIVRDAIKRSGI